MTIRRCRQHKTKHKHKRQRWEKTLNSICDDQLQTSSLLMWFVLLWNGVLLRGSEPLHAAYCTWQPPWTTNTPEEVWIHLKSFRPPCKPSWECSFCGDFWPPTETGRPPSSAEGRRWGRGTETSPWSPPPLLVVDNCSRADQHRPGNSRQSPESTDLTSRAQRQGWERVEHERASALIQHSEITTGFSYNPWIKERTSTIWGSAAIFYFVKIN